MYKEEVDILETISSLNNHEVFTPPKVARAMLDLLPQEVWSNPAFKFLDPCAKTGVFLREIMFRLNESLPRLNESGGDFYHIHDKDGKNSKSYNLNDNSQRLLHIRRNMLFGIGTSDLTGKLTRRTLYGVMIANKDKNEILLNKDINVDIDYKGLNSTYDYRMWDDCCAYRQRDGNIFHSHNKPQHRFNKNDKCIDCGMGKDYSENEDDENYAYPFIHENVSTFIQEIRSGEMKFDVIIGNPPYQISDGSGGAGKGGASPIYHKFVNLAIELSPSYVVMITPSRWMFGGKGLSEFRRQILLSNFFETIYHFEDSKKIFPIVEIEGGICYWLGRPDKTIKKKIPITVNNCETFDIDLSEFDIIITNKIGLSVTRKIKSMTNDFMSNIVSPQTPFGIHTNFKDFEAGGDVRIYGNKKSFGKNGIGYINKESVKKNSDLIGKHKVLISKANGAAVSNGLIIGTPFYTEPMSICSQTYLVASSFGSKLECDNLIKYMSTKFFRFLVSIRKSSQDGMRDVYSYVPHLPMSEEWTDEKLYKKYNLTQEEISHIESSIKEML